MNDIGPGRRALSTGALARVEGEGAMHIEVRDGELAKVELNIYEPPRFFEGFLRGRGLAEPVDITARICGICPVAYQMSACAALEDAIGAVVDGALYDLRRLLYCGEWIESHTLHIHLLHAPDFLGYDSAIELANDHRPLVERGLEIKKIGNELVEAIGGRAIHPINVKLGGFYRVPTRAELDALVPQLERGLDLAIGVVADVAGLEFPDQEVPYELVSTDAGDEYPMMGSRIVTSRGLDIDVASFPDYFEEIHVEHSTALHGRRRSDEGGDYLVGPLARINLNLHQLPPPVRKSLDECGIHFPSHNMFHSIVARAIELHLALHEAIRLLENYRLPDEPYIPLQPREGNAFGCTEAPRGILWHRYDVDDQGIVRYARIVPPTSQNQGRIEEDVRLSLQNLGLDKDDAVIRLRAEQVIRNYDPCISCATHFLQLKINR